MHLAHSELGFSLWQDQLVAIFCAQRSLLRPGNLDTLKQTAQNHEYIFTYHTLHVTLALIL